jgi:RNA polymerase sigma-70 factor (ECF subfamily)
MQELLEMIARLPDLQQAVLRMKHVEGFEVEEIAQLTGTNPVAVRTNLSRARKKIREQFLKNNKEWN